MGTIRSLRRSTSLWRSSGLVCLVDYSSPGLYHSAKARITDYIDLYLLHDPLAGKTKRLDSWRALIDGKKAGKIRTIGVSN